MLTNKNIEDLDSLAADWLSFLKDVCHNRSNIIYKKNDVWGYTDNDYSSISLGPYGRKAEVSKHLGRVTLSIDKSLLLSGIEGLIAKYRDLLEKERESKKKSKEAAKRADLEGLPKKNTIGG